jgi:hypothetical protein
MSTRYRWTVSAGLPVLAVMFVLATPALRAAAPETYYAVKEGTRVRGTPNPGQDGAATRGYTFRAFAPAIQGDAVRANRAATSAGRVK